MLHVPHLLEVADAYKLAAGISADTTVSSRVFGDSKKITALRAGGDITVGRFNSAIQWFRGNWPSGAAMPDVLRPHAAEHATPTPASSAPVSETVNTEGGA